MHKTSGNGTTFAVGLVCGGVIGAAIGVLFAPKTGRDTRRALARSVDGMRLQAMDAYDGASDAISSVTKRGADLVDDLTDAVRGRSAPAVTPEV